MGTIGHKKIVLVIVRDEFELKHLDSTYIHYVQWMSVRYVILP